MSPKDVIFIIIAIVAFVISARRKMVKAQEQAKTLTERRAREQREYEDLVQAREDVSPHDQLSHFRPIADTFAENPIDIYAGKEGQSIMGDLTIKAPSMEHFAPPKEKESPKPFDFNAKQAIIFSEILKPKFEEFA